MNVQQIFTERLPYKPYCSNDKKAGKKLPAVEAIGYKHIQYNSPVSAGWLVFDLDYDYREKRDCWSFPILPVPTITTFNPENGHAHVFYGLETPVAKSELAHAAPLRYFASVEDAYRTSLSSDPGYAGLMAKNPFNPAWRTELYPKLYSLDELAEYVELPKRLQKRDAKGLGRNCTLFDELRIFAYKSILQYRSASSTYERFLSAIESQAHAMNLFAAPLPFSEIVSVARSVAKWVWQRFNDANFSKIQSERGKLSGKARLAASADKRASARLMVASGISIRQVAATLDVGKSTVADWMH